MSEFDAGVSVYVAGAAVMAGLLVCMALLAAAARWRGPGSADGAAAGDDGRTWR